MSIDDPVKEEEMVKGDLLPFEELFKLGTFRGKGAFNTWQHRLTVNHVLMHFRNANQGSRFGLREVSQVEKGIS